MGPYSDTFAKNFDKLGVKVSMGHSSQREILKMLLVIYTTSLIFCWNSQNDSSACTELIFLAQFKSVYFLLRKNVIYYELLFVQVTVC